MNLSIRHRTTYSYSEKVFLEPHHLYFQPAQRPYYSLSKFDINIAPEYEGLAERVDEENNHFHQVWFKNPLNKLEIDVEITLSTSEMNPFNFLMEDSLDERRIKSLALFVEKIPLPHEIEKWLDEKVGNSDNQLDFFIDLCHKINAGWEYTTRYETDLHTPDICFKAREGSCRDLAWMMINMLRLKDIPARFVSGYAFNPELGTGHELHAWVEAWINGAGWIGLDPSAGLLITDQYIPIVTSHHPYNTFPVQGTYRGAAKSHLNFMVEITQL